MNRMMKKKKENESKNAIDLGKKKDLVEVSEESEEEEHEVVTVEEEVTCNLLVSPAKTEIESVSTILNPGISKEVAIVRKEEEELSVCAMTSTFAPSEV